MAAWRPLSRRDDPTYDEPWEGLPDHLLEPVQSWIATVVSPSGWPNPELLRLIQLRLRMSPPLEWGSDSRWTRTSLLGRIEDDPDLGLNTCDLLLGIKASSGYRARLATVLLAGGSVWQLADPPEAPTRLVRRAPGPVADALADVRTVSERAHDHLRLAWVALMGRAPDPSGAYREAVRAVEAAAAPVVLPKDPSATLGKVIRALRAKPEKWEVILERGTVEQVAGMTEALWKGQSRPPRHPGRVGAAACLAG